MNLLNKVLARLKQFYEKKTVELQTGQEPGAAVEAPPPKPKEYHKSGGAGGALQLIAMIIEDAKRVAESDKAETEASLLAVEQELTSLKDLNIGLHADCDFLLKNFEIRQTARKEEMDAIVEAKAILSGADFGL